MLNSVMGIQEWKGKNFRTLSDLGTKVSSQSEASDLCLNLFDFSDPILDGSSTIDLQNPENIYVQYKYDLDLRKIHSLIRTKVISFLLNVEKNKENRKKYEMMENNDLIPPISKRLLKIKIDKANEEICISDKRKLWDLYKERSIQILNRYCVLMSREFKNEIFSGNDISFDESKVEERLNLISTYLNLINEIDIIRITVIHDRRITVCCPGCLKVISVKTNSCSCGFQSENIRRNIEYFDGTKTLPQISASKVNISAFTEWLDDYLCRSKKLYNSDILFPHFDMLCLQNGYSPREYVKSGVIAQPDANIILGLLKQTKIKTDQCEITGSEYNSQKNWIRHEYYGWPKPILSPEQEKEAIELYINIQSLYQKHKKRKSNIFIDTLGMYVLFGIGINVKKADFKIPVSQETIAYSNETMEIIFYELNINFIKLI